MSFIGKCAIHMQLIEAVRQHEVLYNSDHLSYSDNVLKMRLWREIARNCNIAGGDEAKKIWKNLRDGYRCCLKTLRIYEKKDPPRTLKPWKYVEEMDFLKPYMKDRVFTNAAYYENEPSADQLEKSLHFKTADDNTMDSDVNGLSIQGSVGGFSGADTDVQEEIECKPDVTLLAQQELLNQLQDYDMKGGRDSPSQNTNILTSQAMAQLEALSSIYQHPGGLQITAGHNTISQSRKRGQKRKNDVDLVPQRQSPHMFESNHTIENVDPTEDSLKLFFDSMYAAAKTLPVALQRLIRIKLFQTVTDAELAAESMQLQSQYSNQSDGCD